jgi:hypothetical protein
MEIDPAKEASLEREAFEKILELQDLHQKLLPADAFNNYSKAICKGAIKLFHKASIDSFFAKSIYWTHHGIKYSIRYRNIDSFRHIYDTYADGKFVCVDLLFMYVNNFSFNALKHLAMCPKLAPETKQEIFKRICRSSSLRMHFYEIIDILVPQLETGSFMRELVDADDIRLLKIVARHLKNLKNSCPYDLVKDVVVRGTKQQLEYLCSVPEFGSAYLKHLSKKKKEIRPTDICWRSEGFSIGAYLFTFVYDQRHLSEIHHFLDYGINGLIVITSYWIRPKRNLYKLYTKVYPIITQNRKSSYRIMTNIPITTPPAILANSVEQFLTTRSNFKLDVKLNLVKQILRPKSLAMQMILFE